MGNLDFGNIAIGASIVGLLNLLTVILVKTETILKLVERIKAIIRLDYKARAKRNDDEFRLLGKYEQVSHVRIQKTFVSFFEYGCRWTWDWNSSFEPQNIKGRCAACGQPIYAHFAKGPKKKKDRLSTLIYVGVYCSSEKKECTNRAYFNVLESENNNLSADEIVNKIIYNTILSERTKRISNEVQKLRWQFWR